MADPFAIEFEEATAYLRDKLRLPTESWTDIWQGQHARAFVVAGAQSDALLADFHEAVTSAIAEGRTLADFRKDFDRIVAAHGWSYRGSRGWRSRVIYETNMRMAHAAGRWKQILQRARAEKLYIRYISILDDRTRPAHRAWNDIILPADHPWWDTHFPPNGWNCRCSIQVLTKRDIERLGLRISDGPPPGIIEDRTLKTPGGPVQVKVPEGIDTGFAYNPGVAGYGRGAQRKALAEHGGGFQALTAPGAPEPDDAPLPVDPNPFDDPLPHRTMDEATLRARLREVLGGDEAIFADPAGGHVTVGQALIDHYLETEKRSDGRERYLRLIPELIRHPAEVWLGFATAPSGRVVVRRRYVRLVEIDKERIYTLVADADGGLASAVTFFRGKPSYIRRLRSGYLLWKRQEA